MKLHLQFVVTDDDGRDRDLILVGQYARTLRALIQASSKGITALDVSNTWALRLGHYVFVLRREHNIDIETRREEHDGATGKGWHARYVLHTRCKLSGTDEAEAA